MIIVLLVSILSWSASGADVNIVRGKPIYVSSSQENSPNINDGRVESCVSIEDQNTNWIAVDLKNVMQIKKIVIKGHYVVDNEPISIFVGDDFQPCYFHKQYKNLKLCKTVTLKGEESTNIECDKAASKGQYLVLFKGDFTSEKIAERLFLCDLELYGDAVSKSVQKPKPEVQSEQIQPVSANDFAIAKEIRRGVSTFTIPSYSQSFSYISNCQPLIWDVEKSAVFSLVCTSKEGRGRLATFGKNRAFADLKSNDPLKVNLIKWLSPNSKSPQIIAEESISTMQDLQKVKKGDILDFDTQKVYPGEVLSSIIAMIKNETISVVVDWTFYAGTSDQARESYMSVLDIFNVDFNDIFVTWDGDRRIPVKDGDFNENIMAVDDQISRMAKSNQIFLKNSNSIGQKISSTPLEILQKTNVKASLQSIITKYTPLLEYICPCKASPAIDSEDRKLLNALSEISLNQLLVNSNFKMPCIDLFPGDFDKSPPKKTVSLKVQGQFDSTDNPIGYYLEAGSTLKYVVQKSSGEWSIKVGCHTDHLDKNRPEWFRYPNIFVDKVHLDEKGEVYSPFGGVVWLNNEKKGDSISITLSNVVATPFFNLRDKNAASKWDSEKNNPGLWAVIAGDNIVFCEKSSKLRSMSGKYLENLMANHWDKLVKMDYAIKNLNWKEKRPEITALDIMVNFGFGHSGYPIVVWDSWHPEIFDEKKIIKEGSWGMCHEIGHNMQDPKWTFEDVGEVTNNVLCLFNYDKLWNVKRYGYNETEFRGETESILAHLNGRADYKSWSENPWVALGIYAQMANHFGWGFYKKVFGFYETNINSVSGEKEKIAMWQNVTCRISKQNLSPMFDFWGVPMDNAVKSEVAKLPCFFPDDFFRKMSPKRTNVIMTKYPNCNGKSTFNEDYDPKPDIVGIRPNFIESV